MSLRIFTHFLLGGYSRQLTLCMLVFWSHEGVVFLPSPNLITSFHLPCLGSTDVHCPRLGDPVPLLQSGVPFHRVRAHSLTGVQNTTVHIYSLWEKSSYFLFLEEQKPNFLSCKKTICALAGPKVASDASLASTSITSSAMRGPASHKVSTGASIASTVEVAWLRGGHP